MASVFVKFTESVGLQGLMKGGEIGYFSVHSQNAKICEPWNQRRRSAFGWSKSILPDTEGHKKTWRKCHMTACHWERLGNHVTKHEWRQFKDGEKPERQIVRGHNTPWTGPYECTQDIKHTNLKKTSGLSGGKGSRSHTNLSLENVYKSQNLTANIIW